MKKAITLLFEDNKFEKIVIVRPAVEAGTNPLGYLKGGLLEKMEPYVAPSFYLLNKIIGKEATDNLRNEEIVSVMALNYLRGHSIDNTILISEESQNCSVLDIKLLLTRIGFNSKFFISGDIEQTDKFKDWHQSGLFDALERFKDLPKIGMFEFGIKDVVRNPIITEILKRY